MVRRFYENKRAETAEYFFYEHPRNSSGKQKLTSLGQDLLKAKMKWAELERASNEAAGITVEERSLSAIYAKYLSWAQNREQSGLSLRTLQDREKYWKKLAPVFEAVPIDGFKPEYMVRYFDNRSSKVSAKKEIKFLSVIFN
jgi:hypothetical protein